MKRTLSLLLALLCTVTQSQGALTFGNATSDRLVIGTTSSSTNDLTAATMIMWIYPTTVTGGRLLFRKDANPATANRKNLRISTSSTLDMTVARATTAATAQSQNSQVSANTWQCVAFTYDESDGPRLFHGTLTSPIAEVSAYNSRAVGSGATSADGTTLWIGNQQHATPTLAFQGRIAMVHYIAARLTGPQLIALQYRPRVIPETVYFAHLLDATTVPDLSGEGNTGTGTGLSVADHVPLGGLYSHLRDFFWHHSFGHLGYEV
jgi:hypothetical protein